MPTGYTYGIANGSVTTLREFALTAARGMSALLPLREAPPNAPIPRRFEPDTKYLDEQLDKTRTRLAELSAMDGAARREACAAYNAEVAEENARASAAAAAQRERYDAMLAKVKNWKGAPEGLKEFMLDQLVQSRDSDCPEDSAWYAKIPLGVDEWHRSQLDQAARDISYYERRRAEEIARTTARNAWLEQLWASLPPEDAE
jgi:hypothetical protein